VRGEATATAADGDSDAEAAADCIEGGVGVVRARARPRRSHAGSDDCGVGDRAQEWRRDAPTRPSQRQRARQSLRLRWRRRGRQERGEARAQPARRPPQAHAPSLALPAAGALDRVRIRDHVCSRVLVVCLLLRLQAETRGVGRGSGGK
jgi:hypothetical protein